MRIVVDLQGAQAENRLRGIGRYSLSLAKALVRQAQDHEIRIALNGWFENTIEPLRSVFDGLIPQDRIVVFDTPGPVAEMDEANLWRARAAERLREHFLASLRPDVTFLSSLFEGWAGDAATSIGLLNTPSRSAVTLYDLIPLLMEKIYLRDSGFRDWYFRKLDSLKRADLLLSISECSRQDAINAFCVPNDRVVNISGAADDRFRVLKLSHDEMQEILAKFNLTRPFVMYTGGIDHRKNIEGLIEAFALMPESLRGIHQLAIVCSVNAADRKRLEALAAGFGLCRDEIVFTGYVADEEIVALYNLCVLYVFPSLYEGFGLPALEAMQCGAAVIASNTSSIPEVIGRGDALFDPNDPHSIAAKMTEALSDDGFRRSLCGHGVEQSKRFSWDETARRALAAMEDACRPHKERERIFFEMPRPRPLMAYISPLPPEPTGIADYSAELLPELSRYYEIEVVVSQERMSDPWVRANFPIRNATWFDQHADRFDRLLYHIGNSGAHGYQFDLLEKHAGMVVLHDFFLSNAFDYLDRIGVRPGWLAQNLFLSHGYKALKSFVQDREQAVWTYPANKPVLDRAGGVIVHSNVVKHWAENHYGRGFTTDWHVVPQARRLPYGIDRCAARARLGIGQDVFLTCSFGLLGPTKLNHRLLDAWLTSRLSQDERCQLTFVGQNAAGAYGADLNRRIRQCGVGDRIKITGWASKEMYRNYLAAADLAVQLRTRSRGETPRSMLDCLAHGTPTVINAHGTAADFPESVVVKLPDDFTDEALAAAIDHLRKDDADRARLERSGIDFIRTRHSPALAAAMYRNAIESMAGQGHVAEFLWPISAVTGSDVTSRSASGSPVPLCNSALNLSRSHPPLTPPIKREGVISRPMRDGSRVAEGMNPAQRHVALDLRPDVHTDRDRSSYRPLVESIGQISCPIRPTEQDFVALATCLARQMEHSSVADRVYVDISVLIFNVQTTDLVGDGRRVLTRILERGSSSDFEVIPVYFDGTQFRSSLKYVYSLAGAQTPVVKDEPILITPRSILIEMSFGDASGRTKLLREGLNRGLIYYIGRLIGSAHDPDEVDDSLAEVNVLPSSKPDDKAARLEEQFFQCGMRLERVGAVSNRANIRSIYVDGPFDSSYSLAIVNRNVALQLNAKGYDIALESMDAGIPFDPSPRFLKLNPGIRDMYMLRRHMQEPDVHLRYCYPPLTGNMRGKINAIHSYGWEESGFPQEYVQWLNGRLDFVTVLSNYVGKVLRDNGLTIPFAVTGAGVDHIEDVTGEPVEIEDLRSFKFLHVSSSFPRKGVDVLLRAYASAFSIKDDVSLIIKTFPNPHNDVDEQLRALCSKNPEFPHVIFINEDWTDGKMKGLYQLADVFVAVSRGEGFGLPMAEAMMNRVPVITTAYGGQREFCSEDTALLCDYRFAYAKTHLSRSSSVWVEPSVSHLTDLLRQAYEMPEDRRDRLTASAARQIAHFTWRRSASSIVKCASALPGRTLASGPLVWVTTWNTRCGIADYAKHLSCNFETARMSVLASRTKDRVEADEPFVERCWDKNAALPVDELLTRLRTLRPQAVIVQYAYGFFSLEQLARIVQECSRSGADSFVFFHSTGPVYFAGGLHYLGELRDSSGGVGAAFREVCDILRCATRIAVHSVNDLNNLKHIGIVDNVMVFPHGVWLADRKKPHPLADKLAGKRVIASYGYLLPPKGIPELVHAFALVREQFRDAHLLLANSLYPIPESVEEEAKVRKLVSHMGLTDSVTAIHDFLSDGETLSLLKCAEMIVYPYRQTQESSSAAVRTGLSAGRAVAVTPLPIFDDLGAAVHRFSGTSVTEIAEGLALLLNDSQRRRNLEDAASSWSAEHSFKVLSSRLANVIEGCRRQKEFDSLLAHT